MHSCLRGDGRCGEAIVVGGGERGLEESLAVLTGAMAPLLLGEVGGDIHAVDGGSGRMSWVALESAGTL
jgi:hypothetical protein